MNQQTVASIFNELFEEQLAPFGFVMSETGVAERTLIGFKQLVTWSFTRNGMITTFSLDVRLSYSHELDHVTSNVAVNDGNKPACRGHVRVLHMSELLTERVIRNRLNGVRRQLVNLLNDTRSANRIYAAVYDDLSNGPALLGHDHLGLSFNYAYCMELAGMPREAAQMYADLSRGRRSNRSPFAIRLREVARERAIALTSFLTKDTLDQLAKSKPAEAVGAPIAAIAIPESELAKFSAPQHIRPDEVLPGKFLEAIAEAYSPAQVFWCNIDAERLVSELEKQHPEYMKAVATCWENAGCGSFHEDLVNSIRTRQFDEYCAQWLLSLPHEQVSNDDDDAVYELLHHHLQRTDNATHLGYLELDGVKAISYIRDRMDFMLS
ncbi:hypothetical protein [Paraburkholderia tropica]|uniref:hypothetical protein n=1 Tax=Paraburkholderia tropica TaxID=92647 RepID=UPI002ABE1B70|nr:hypothetical protein [Paraburkholderia tropica]